MDNKNLIARAADAAEALRAWAMGDSCEDCPAMDGTAMLAADIIDELREALMRGGKRDTQDNEN